MAWHAQWSSSAPCGVGRRASACACRARPPPHGRRALTLGLLRAPDRDVRDGVVVALVDGGQAKRDGLMRVGDRVVAVDGVRVQDGERLRHLLPSQGPFDLTVQREQPELSEQLLALGLSTAATYRLLKVPVRRGADGLGWRVLR